MGRRVCVSCQWAFSNFGVPKNGEMQTLDAQIKLLVLQSAVDAERLVAGKLEKDTYVGKEKLISGKPWVLVTKIEHILDTLWPLPLVPRVAQGVALTDGRCAWARGEQRGQ